MTLRCALHVTTTLAGLLGATAARAQGPLQTERRLVAQTSTCGSCRITVGPPLQLQANPDAPFAQAPVALTRDGRGYYYLIEEGSDGSVEVFDRAGRFLRTLGRPGGGPGEFRVPESILLDAHDTVHVIDARGLQRTVLTPAPEWQYVRRTPIPRVTGAVLLGGGRMAINAELASGNAAGMPLHLLSVQGVVEHSFGAAGPFDAKAHPWTRRRVLATSAKGFWAAHVLSYAVELWSADGRKLAELYREPAWFAPRDAPLFASSEHAPSAELVALREDANGLLWMLIVVPGTDWRRGLGTPSVKRGPVTGWTKLDHIPQLLFETVIEVIDPVRGTLLASQRVPGLYPFFVGTGQIGGYRTAADQVPVPEVRDIALSR